MTDVPRRAGLPSWTPLDDATTMVDLDHLTDACGPLSTTTRGRVYAAVLDPAWTTWCDARMVVVDGETGLTLWRAAVRWAGYDRGFIARIAPDEQQVRRALHGAAVHARAREAYRAAASRPLVPFDQQPAQVQRQWWDRIAEQDRAARRLGQG